MNNHREELKDEYHYPNSVVYGLNDKIKSKDAQIKLSREALEKYASHEHWCLWEDEDNCTCGLDKALAELDKIKVVP